MRNVRNDIPINSNSVIFNISGLSKLETEVTHGLLFNGADTLKHGDGKANSAIEESRLEHPNQGSSLQELEASLEHDGRISSSSVREYQWDELAAKHDKPKCTCQLFKCVESPVVAQQQRVQWSTLGQCKLIYNKAIF